MSPRDALLLFSPRALKSLNPRAKAYGAKAVKANTACLVVIHFNVSHL